MGRPTREEVTNLTIKVSEKTKIRLNGLVGKSEAGSLTEVIRRALAVYDTLLDCTDNGGKVLVRDKDGNEQLIVLP